MPTRLDIGHIAIGSGGKGSVNRAGPAHHLATGGNRPVAVSPAYRHECGQRQALTHQTPEQVHFAVASKQTVDDGNAKALPSYPPGATAAATKACNSSIEVVNPRTLNYPALGLDDGGAARDEFE